MNEFDTQALKMVETEELFLSLSVKQKELNFEIRRASLLKSNQAFSIQQQLLFVQKLNKLIKSDLNDEDFVDMRTNLSKGVLETLMALLSEISLRHSPRVDIDG